MQKGFFSVCSLAAAVGGLTAMSCVTARGIEQAQEQVRLVLPVVLFFQANLPEEQTRATAEALKNQDPFIEEVTYISREQAYTEAGKDPSLSRSLMLLHDNPFSAAAEIRYSARAWLDRQDPAQNLRSLPGLQDIRWSAQRRDIFLAFEPWKTALRHSLWGVGVLLLVWAMCGIRAFAVQLTEWKHLGIFLLAGFGGAVVAVAVGLTIFRHLGISPVLLSWHSIPILPVLFGGLIGLGSFRESGS